MPKLQIISSQWRLKWINWDNNRYKSRKKLKYWKCDEQRTSKFLKWWINLWKRIIIII
jgi:hypothetical protein